MTEDAGGDQPAGDEVDQHRQIDDGGPRPGERQDAEGDPRHALQEQAHRRPVRASPVMAAAMAKTPSTRA